MHWITNKDRGYVSLPLSQYMHLVIFHSTQEGCDVKTGMGMLHVCKASEHCSRHSNQYLCGKALDEPLLVMKTVVLLLSQLGLSELPS